LCQRWKGAPVSRVLSSDCSGLHHLSLRPTLRGRTSRPPVCLSAHIPGLHGLTARKVYPSHRSCPRCWWALTPPFHHHPIFIRQSESLWHYLYPVCRHSGSPAFHGVRRPVQPGLSSSVAGSDEAVRSFQHKDTAHAALPEVVPTLLIRLSLHKPSV
jgi:hypothetical protein